MNKFLTENKRWLVPLALFLVITPFTPYLDITFSSFFYNSHLKKFSNNGFYQWIFDYAQYPAIIVPGLATVVFILSYFKRSWEKHREKCLMLILAVIVGPGLIINVFLKPGWGRPRPRQVEELGGDNPFYPYYSPHWGHYSSDQFRSMPSGHASMGFYFFAVAVLGERFNRRRIKIAGYCLAFGLGSLLGLARIAQGGHFFSDVVISALITWCVALTLNWMLFDERLKQKTV